MNETEIVIQMQQGKEEAFDLLFDMYKNKAFRLAYLISGSYTDSEDIVQEAFVKVVNSSCCLQVKTPEKGLDR